MKPKSVLSISLLLLLFSGCSNSPDIVGPENDIAPSTIIYFEIPEPGHVQLWVENAYKTKVITVVSGNRDRGFHAETIEMIDYNGNFLTEGIYTYHLKTEYGAHSGILFFKNHNF